MESALEKSIIDNILNIKLFITRKINVNGEYLVQMSVFSFN